MWTVNGPPASRSRPSAASVLAGFSGRGAAGTMNCPATPPGEIPNSSARPPGLGAGASPVDGVSPTQSASAADGSASASATPAATAELAAARHRVGRAELSELRGLVGLTRHAADSQHAHAVGPCVDLALGVRPNPDDGLRIQRDALPINLDLAAAAHDRVDLLLTALGVVVLRKLLEVRRQVHYLHAERLDAELRTSPLERTTKRRFHVVNPLYRAVSH